MMSPQPTSSIEPMERKALNPTFCRKLQSNTDTQRAPLWLMNATFPWRAILLMKGRVQTEVRNHNAAAIRPDHPHSAAACGNLLFELHPGSPGFSEAGRNDHCTRDSRFFAFADYVWNGKRGRSDHGQIHWGWDISNPWEGF